MTASKKPKPEVPTWSDVKAKLVDFDRGAVLGLIQDLYAASKDNRNFLNARFGLGGDVLEPYRLTIDRWLWPDVLKNQDTSIVNAKRAISDYQKAVGQPEGTAELMVFFCERAAGFANEFGLQDDGYFNALVRMFEQALKMVTRSALAQREALLGRLDAVRDVCSNFGYGVGDDMDTLMARYGVED